MKQALVSSQLLDLQGSPSIQKQWLTYRWFISLGCPRRANGDETSLNGWRHQKKPCYSCYMCVFFNEHSALLKYGSATMVFTDLINGWLLCFDRSLCGRGEDSRGPKRFSDRRCQTGRRGGFSKRVPKSMVFADMARCCCCCCWCFLPICFLLWNQLLCPGQAESSDQAWSAATTLDGLESQTSHWGSQTTPAGTECFMRSTRPSWCRATPLALRFNTI